MSSKNNPSLKEFYQRQLEIRERAYKAGVLPALYEAIYLCKEADFPSPPWVTRGMLVTLEKLFSGKFADGLGRKGNPKARYAEDLKHFMRWDVVNEIREYQKGHWAEYQVALKDPKFSDDSIARLRADPPRDYGTTLDDTFYHAAEVLKGTIAFGSNPTIKRSYFLVNKAAKDSSQNGRFYLVGLRTRKRLGLKTQVVC